MATILPFKRGIAQKTSASPSMKGKADIVIFPGVRYERWGDFDRVRGATAGLRQEGKPRRGKR